MTASLKTFEECIEKVSYKSKIQRTEYLSDGKYPIVSQESNLVNGYWNHENDLFIVDKPIIVFGDHTRALKFVDFSFVLGADGAKIIQPKSFIDSKYFYYFLQANPLEDKGYARHYRFLKELKLAVPPLKTQERISAKLDEIFYEINKALEATQTNVKNSEALFQSYLNQVFGRGGDGWVELQLQELLEKGWIVSHLDGNHGGDYPRKEEFVSSGVPYISANCLDGDVLDLTKSKFLSKERASKLRKGLAKNDDVLFAHNATVGPVTILKTLEEITILGTSLTYYRCNKEFIEPEYLANYMRSAKFRNQYLTIMQQSTRNQIPITKQREFFHVIPPLKTQKELIQKFTVFLSMKSMYESQALKKIEELLSLKKSILRQAFNGELVKD